MRCRAFTISSGSQGGKPKAGGIGASPNIFLPASARPTDHGEAASGIWPDTLGKTVPHESQKLDVAVAQVRPL